MKPQIVKIAVGACAIGLMASPTALAAGKSGEAHGKAQGHQQKAKAYGRYCKDESRKHVKGEKGTPFSRCVRNIAQANRHENMAPGRVCKGESRKHVKGEKGTAFSRCVRDVVALRRQERKEAREERREAREAEQEGESAA